MARHIIIGISLFLLSYQISAQGVSFIHQTQLLNAVSGFTAYSDCSVDMNGDLLDDVVRTGNKGIYIDFQQADGNYIQQFFPVAISSPPSWSICAGDLDNNGYNDLLFGHLGTASFLRANEYGSAYTETVMPGFIVSQRSNLVDINNDGWLDAFVCNDTAQSIPYRNDGFGNMSPDLSLIYTANLPGSYASIWIDYDDDHDTDLYLTKCLGGAPPTDSSRINLLYRNNGDGTFDEVGHQAGLDDNAQSWSTVFEDFDNDGDFDAFIVNHDMQNRLYRNNGDGTFTDVITASGINALDLGAWENASGDFNNDGFVDIYSELNAELYLGNGDLTFTGQDASVTPGAIADLNNDGFLDVCKSGQVWLNEGNENHWLKIIPRGITSNRNGIGARIEIYGAWGKQTREVRSGQSYSPMSSLTAHFGLGTNSFVDSVKIVWPSGVETKLYSLIADSTYFVPEVNCLLPDKNEISVLGSPLICPGDTTTLIAPDGYVSYLWSNNQAEKTIPVFSEGRYFVISMDSAGCAMLSDPVEITYQSDESPVIFAPGGNVICEGDTLILKSSPGQNYEWSNGIHSEQIINVSESGIYTVAIDGICNQEQLFSLPLTVEVLTSIPPVADDVVILEGDSVLLMASGENCQWYDQPIGGNLLATGPMLQTMPLTSSATYYVESHHLYNGRTQTGGKQDTTGMNGIPSQGGFLIFEAWTPFNLVSVDVYVPSTGPLIPRFVQLWSKDSLLAFKRFELQPGINTLDLNFNVPVGKFSLQCQQGNLWRNTGSLNYPYLIGDAGQINTSSFGDNYYYYFYDWKIKKADLECISERTAVQVLLSGRQEFDVDTIVSVSPNPTSGFVWVDLNEQISGIKWIRILDFNGHEVLFLNTGLEAGYRLDFKDFPAGVYCLQISGDSFFETKTILKI